MVIGKQHIAILAFLLYQFPLQGTQKWAYGTGSTVIVTPTIISDGTIYVGSMDQNMYAINSDGNLIIYYIYVF